MLENSSVQLYINDKYLNEVKTTPTPPPSPFKKKKKTLSDWFNKISWALEHKRCSAQVRFPQAR